MRPPWWAALPAVETRIRCGTGEHVLRWSQGRLHAADHPDAEGELVLAALGGDKAECVAMLEVWGAHADDLDVLALTLLGGGLSAQRGAGAPEMLEHHVHPAQGSTQRGIGVEHDVEAQRPELVCGELRSGAALHDVGQQRPVEATADLGQLVLGFRRLDEDDVGARVAVELRALQRRLEPEHLTGIGAGDDEQRVVRAGVECGVELGHHLGRRDDLLTREVATALGEHLVLELDGVGAAPLAARARSGAR